MPRFVRNLAAVLVLALWVAGPAVAQRGSGDDKEEGVATLALTFTNNDLPLTAEEVGKFYIYEVGERKKYVAWGHANRIPEFPEGIYDLVIRYENGEIEETITREEFEFIGDIEEEITFNVPVAHLKVDITRGGLPVDPFTGSYAVYRSGRRDRPLVRKRPGTEITIRPGTYDVEVVHRSADGMKTRWVEGILVDGSAHESVELGLPRARLAQITVTLIEDGRRIPPEAGTWRIFDSGQRSSPLAERRSGEQLEIEKGTYDIGAFVTRNGTKEERWWVDVRLDDDLEREIEMGTPTITLRVNVNADGSLQRRAWYSVYAVGQRDSPLLSVRSGDEVTLEPGTYDIGCFLRDGGLRDDQWLRGHAVREPSTLDVDLTHRAASLRVIPRESRRRRDQNDPRLLVVMDSSSRMGDRMEGGTRLSVALPAVADGLSALPASVQVGLRALGGEPEAARECQASSLRVTPQASNAEALTEALSGLQPTGAAPVAYALEQAVSDLPPGPENTLVLITAGADGCGGDLCTAAARLLRDGRVGRLFVIGFDMDRDQMRRMDCVGEQIAVQSGTELTAALREVLRRTADTNVASQGSVAVFRSDRPSEWVAGGSVGDKIMLNEGTYDILIRSRGRSYTWSAIQVTGDYEATAGRRPRRR